MMKIMKQLNLESLETRTLLAVGDVLDGEIAGKITDLAHQLIEDVFSGDASKLSDAEALAKKYLGVADTAGETHADDHASTATNDHDPKKKQSKVKKLASKFEKLAGGLFDKLTGDDSDEDSHEASKTGNASTKSAASDKSSSLFDKVGDVLGGIADKVTGDSSDKTPEGDAGHSGIADKIGDVLGGIADKVTGDSSDKTSEGDTGHSGIVDKIGDVLGEIADKVAGDSSDKTSEGDAGHSGIADKIGDVFDKVTSIFGDSDPDAQLNASSEKLSGILAKVRERIHAFGGEGSPAGGKIGIAAAHLMDVTGDVIDSLTGFIDDATDSSPEKEHRVETALKIAAAALEGVSGITSLVGAAVPGVSAAAPVLNTVSGVLEGASAQSSKVLHAAEKAGNIIGKGGHAMASVLDKISDKLDPAADADEVVSVDAGFTHVVDSESIAVNQETEVLVA
jgi:hypothetical protein